MSIRVKDPRNIQSAYDDRFDPANELHEAETTSDDGYTKDKSDRSEAYAANDSAREVRESEESTEPGYVNKFTGAAIKKVKATGKVSKIGGVAGIVIAILLAIAGIVSFFGGPGLVLVNMAEVLTEKFNYQLGSLDVRHQKIMYAKIANTTTGKCGAVVNIACKYTTFSDKEIANFKQAGIEVELDGKSVLGRNKVKSLKVGETVVTARNFREAMRSPNMEFSNAMKRAYNMKYAGMSDNIFNKAAQRLGISKKAPFEEGIDDRKRAETIDKETREGRASSSGDGYTCANPDNCTEEEQDRKKRLEAADEQASKLTDSHSEASSNQADDIIAQNSNQLKRGATDATGEITQEAINTAQRSLKGTAASVVKITGLIDNACMVFGWTKTISLIAKVNRATQMARYAMIFLSIASMIKAGDARPDDVRYLSETITKNDQNTKPGTDSFGYRYAAFGDSGIDEVATTAIAGASFGGTIQQAVDAIIKPLGGRKGADSTCHILANPVVQVGSAVGGILAFFIGGTQIKIAAQMAMAPLIAIVGAVCRQ